MKKSIFTQKDFLNACDSINQITDKCFGIWFDTQDHNSFDGIFTNKDKAKEILLKNVGLEIYGYNIYSASNPYGC
jgi:hypothetical protein